MGKDMMLPMSAVVLFSAYFYLLKLGDVRFLYTSANGLWWEQKYRALIETAFNLVLNITLGRAFGVHGIIIATMVSLFLCNYLWSVSITFRHYFGEEKIIEYYRYQGLETAVMLVAAIGTYLICRLIHVDGLLPQLILRAVICVIVPNLIYFLAFRKT